MDGSLGFCLILGSPCKIHIFVNAWGLQVKCLRSLGLREGLRKDFLVASSLSVYTLTRYPSSVFEGWSQRMETDVTWGGREWGDWNIHARWDWPAWPEAFLLEMQWKPGPDPVPGFSSTDLTSWLTFISRSPAGLHSEPPAHQQWRWKSEQTWSDRARSPVTGEDSSTVNNPHGRAIQSAQCHLFALQSHRGPKSKTPLRSLTRNCIIKAP